MQNKSLAATAASYDVSQGLAVYRHLLSYALPYWRVMLVAVISMAVYGATDAGFAMFMKPMLDGGFVNKDPQVIRWLPIFILGIFVVRGVVGFSANYCTVWVGRRVVKTLRGHMFNHLVMLPAAYYDASSSGQLLSKFTYNVEQVAESTTSAVNILVRDSITILCLLAWMFYLSGMLTLIFFVIGLVIAALIRIISRRMRKLSHRIQETMGDITHVAEEAIEGQQVVKTFGGQAYETQQFERVNENNRRDHMKLAYINASNVPVVQFLAACALAAIVYISTTAQDFSHITVGDFVSFMAAMMLLFPPLKRLTTVNAVLQRGIAAGQSIFQMLNEPIEPDGGWRRVARARGALCFDKVSFCYPRRTEGVLHDVQFQVAPGQTVALVGRSGSGKSTLIKLIARFYEITSGRILLDDADIREYRLAELRAQIAYVSQDVTLFNDTVAHNIAYGRLGKASMQDIEAAAEAAHALAFIRELPQGFDTLVGENGVLLSGGQRQRIAIARALLKDAPILLLDEATASLDSESEKIIQVALDALMRQRTTLVIAHRLSTIERADHIVVLDNGKVLETGKHSELLEQSGHYANLYHLQFTQPHAAPSN